MHKFRNMTLGLATTVLTATVITATMTASPAFSSTDVPGQDQARRSTVITDTRLLPMAHEDRTVSVVATVSAEAAPPVPATKPQGRVIDVSLSEQMLRLYDGGDEVFRSPVATGISGAETPIGTFEVQYRMANARFQGVYPNGTRYDVPEVPWILAFSGDYTIHAAPWRSQFGQVGSNGCVTLPTVAARFVYDWAADGTPIHIRH